MWRLYAFSKISKVLQYRLPKAFNGGDDIFLFFLDHLLRLVERSGVAGAGEIVEPLDDPMVDGDIGDIEGAEGERRLDLSAYEHTTVELLRIEISEVVGAHVG